MSSSSSDSVVSISLALPKGISSMIMFDKSSVV